MKRRMLISWVLIPIWATVYWNIGEQEKLTAAALNSGETREQGIGNRQQGRELFLPFNWGRKVLLRSSPLPNAIFLQQRFPIATDNNLSTGETSNKRDFTLPRLAATDDCDPNSPYGCISQPDPRSPSYKCNTPHIISPYNNTYLLNERPPISWWYAVRGVTSYTVRMKDITGLELDWEEIVTESSQNDVIKINYPDDVKSLAPGELYTLTVEPKFESTEKRVESAESIFTMLSRENIQKVQQKVQEIDNLNLSPDEKVLQKYEIYKKSKLIAEATEQLEEVVRDGSQTARVYLILADIYYHQGLHNLAKPYYDTAVRLATEERDIQELAQAQAKLEKINKILKKTCAADP